MATLTINGSTFANVMTAFANPASPTTGSYYAVPPFGNSPTTTSQNYREIEVEYVGVPGISYKRLQPFGPITLHCEIVLIGSLSAVNTARTNFFNSVSQLDRYSIAMPNGATYSKCRAVMGSGKRINQFAIGDKVAQVISHDFQQVEPN